QVARLRWNEREVLIEDCVEPVGQATCIDRTKLPNAQELVDEERIPFRHTVDLRAELLGCLGGRGADPGGHVFEAQPLERAYLALTRDPPEERARGRDA